MHADNGAIGFYPMLDAIPLDSTAYEALYKGQKIVIGQDTQLATEQRLALDKQIDRLHALGLGNIWRTPWKPGDGMPMDVKDPREVLLVTEAGGIHAPQQKHVARFLSETTLKRLLHTEAGERIADMEHRVAADVWKLLPAVGRVVVASPYAVEKEILHWRGSGTLVVAEALLRMEYMTNDSHRQIVQAVIRENEQAGKFRRRRDAECTDLLNNHHVLMAAHTPLGGASLLRKDGGWYEFAGFWASTYGQGLGTRIIAKLLADPERRRNTYALAESEEARRAIEKSGHFQRHQTVRDMQGSGTTTLPEPLRTYNELGRNPVVFTGVEKLPKHTEAG